MCCVQERLEVASALKKQMWSEVQLDKRWKEESLIRANYLSGMGMNVIALCFI